MSNISNVIQITSTLSIPSLTTLLNLPTAVGNVSVSTLSTVLSTTSTDLTRLTIDIKQRDWVDTAELTFTDSLKIASDFGVPGVGIVATFIPYVFDILNMEILGHGHVTMKMFEDAILTSQSNIGQILEDVQNRQYLDVARLGLDDLLDIAGAFGAGPYANILKALINVVFISAINLDAEKSINEFFDEIGDLIENKPITSGGYVWSPLEGWILPNK